MARVPRKPDMEQSRRRERRTQDRIRKKEIEAVPGGLGGGVLSHAVQAFGDNHGSLTGPGTRTLKCDTVTKDDEGLYDTSTGLYTIPEVGWYVVSAAISINVTDDANYIFFDPPNAGSEGAYQATPGPGGFWSVAFLIYMDTVGTMPLKINLHNTGATSVDIRNYAIGMLQESAGGG